MIITDLNNVNQLDKVEVICDECQKVFSRTKKNIRVSRNKHNRDLCQSCAARLSSKPQNSKEFWSDPIRKQKHSVSLKNSIAFKEANAKIDRTGVNNGMFGRKMSAESRAKMSAARMGKVGKNATAWKGGKASLNKRVKRALQKRYSWFSRVIDRAHNKCEICGDPAKDAHHIKPMYAIIKGLLSANDHFTNDDDRLLWLLEQPEVLDTRLENGQALCRPCHKKMHNWGSKTNP